MTISFVAASSITYASRANGATTVSKPTGTVDGDVMVMFALIGDTTTRTFTTPAGWTSVADQTVTAGGFIVRSYTWTKVASGEGSSYTISQSATASTQALIVAYRGVDNTTPQDVTATANTGTGSTSTWTGLTTATAGAWLVGAAHNWGDSTSALSPPTGTPSPVERVDSSATSIVYAWDQVWATAGATGNRTQNPNNNAGSGGWATFLLALRPAGGGGPNEATAAGAVTWGTGGATAARGSNATATGAIGWAGSATAKRVAKATAAGAVDWVGSATAVQPGITPHVATAAGAVDWAGTATAGRPSRATAAGTITWTGSATAAADHRATAAGAAIEWAGSATASAPTVDDHTATAAGTVAWGPGTSTATAQHTVTATGAITWTGSALAHADQRASAAGAVIWGPGAAAAVWNPPDVEPSFAIVAVYPTPVRTSGSVLFREDIVEGDVHPVLVTAEVDNG